MKRGFGHTHTDKQHNTTQQPLQSYLLQRKASAHRAAAVPLQCHWLCLQPADSDEALSSVCERFSLSAERLSLFIFFPLLRRSRQLSYNPGGLIGEG